MATTGLEWLASGARIRAADIAETAFGFCRQNAVGVLQTTFRPFICKGFYLCASCSQKRTLLFAEHLTNEVLMDLPHRQFVFTMPKALRPFFRHDRRLFAEVSRLIYTIITEFYGATAGEPLLTGVVTAFQSFGDQLRWNAHFHSPVVEGGFDEDGRFIPVPLSGLNEMTCISRARLMRQFGRRRTAK